MKASVRMAKNKNERNTENLVRDALRTHGYYDQEKTIVVAEQKTNVEAARKALSAASKTGGSGIGAPEFIITDPENPDFLMVIECKAERKDHCSPLINQVVSGSEFSEDAQSYVARVKRYAADGVLHYAKFLSKEFNVIAIAISGETESKMEFSAYLRTKGSPHPKLLISKEKASIDRIISWSDFIEHATFDPDLQRLRLGELMAFSRQLHDFMRDHAKLTESEKPLLVSGTLIALQNQAFALSFGAYEPNALQKQWFAVIKSEIEAAKIPSAKKGDMAQPYSSIAVHPQLSAATKEYPKGILHELIRLLNEKVRPFISVYHDFDVVGQFYGEFLKYTGGDKKALGIVLTPRHITELFTLLANVDKDSKVLDICCGTGGFLVSAMHQMMRKAVTEDEKEKIREHGLVGVEHLPNMFALAASNMILRGDGKANLHQGSCFDKGITNSVTAFNCDVGMVNPPYSQATEDLHELEFVKQMLTCLKKDSIGVAIVPMSCAISPHPTKAALLKDHTLEAVMSMPDDLFYPVGTVTCIMVFTAKIPHATSKRKTWFGYWKIDGFVRTKNFGRIDQNIRWPAIRDGWVESFRNRDDIAGFSVKRVVTAKDEWCAEAYMETDYSDLSSNLFEREVKKYLLFGLMNEAAEKHSLFTSGASSDAEFEMGPSDEEEN
jgi:type I restriction enzyme M protein